ncbi:MAG: beta-galactosidase [Chthonomonadales bacterium]
MIGCCVALLAAALVGRAGIQEASGLHLSFQTDKDLTLVRTHDTRVERVVLQDGSYALRVEFHPAEWPNVWFQQAEPWNWSGAGALVLEMANPSKETIHFGVRVDDDASANGIVHCRQGSGSIGPGQHRAFAMPLGRDPMSVGMRGLPPNVPGAENLGGSGALDLSHIVAFQVFLHRPEAPKTLLITSIRLAEGVATLEGIVDRFGQYAKADWPGKVHSEAELRDRIRTEERDLARHPAPSDRDEYGGWAHGPSLKATGFFRTERVDGRWWLVTPNGHLFFSLGVDCVGTSADTITTGREGMFTWLPPKSGEFRPCWGYVDGVHSGPVKRGDTFNFFRANLIRQFGEDYAGSYFPLVLKRLRSWGFNTIGNWSDQALYGNGHVPYVGTVHIGGHHARVASGSDYWGTMHDPFDPQFAHDVRESLAPVTRLIGEDPWCVGYFVDNELSWGGGGDEGRYGLALGALSLAADASPAKRAILTMLREQYPDVAALNAAWSTHFTGWAEMEAPVRLHAPFSEAQKRDLGAFVKRFARQYFRVVRDELKRQAPHHLYLGCRFAWYTPESVEASAEYCDVVSFNIYQPKPDGAQWNFLKHLGKPVMIGEFHFGALDRGMFHTGLVAAENQQQRAAMYEQYVKTVAQNPAFVGCHWFQFVDEPLTGRAWDGENYNIGFLTVTDTPYPELVEAARRVHRTIYTLRYGRPTAAR